MAIGCRPFSPVNLKTGWGPAYENMPPPISTGSPGHEVVDLSRFLPGLLAAGSFAEILVIPELPPTSRCNTGRKALIDGAGNFGYADGAVRARRDGCHDANERDVEKPRPVL